MARSQKKLTVNENNQAMQAPSSVPVSKTAHEIAMLATPGNGGRGATSHTALYAQHVATALDSESYKYDEEG